MTEERNQLLDLFTTCWNDEASKHHVMADPKAVLARYWMDGPDGLAVNVVENTDTTVENTMLESPSGFLVNHLRTLVAGLCLCFLLTAGCAAEKTFPTAKALLDDYSLNTRSIADDVDQTGNFLALEPTRYFVPAFGQSKATFDLVVEFYRQQVETNELMRTNLPKEVFEQYIATVKGEEAVFVPIIDPNSLQVQSSITATAPARYGPSSVDVLLVNGPKGWTILWNFDADERTDSQGETMRMGIIRAGITLYEQVGRELSEGTITDLPELWKAFGIKPPS